MVRMRNRLPILLVYGVGHHNTSILSFANFGLKIEFYYERERERESIKVLEVHGAYGALISMSGTCLI